MWIEQHAVNISYRTVLGEREPLPGTEKPNLVTLVWHRFELWPCASLSVPTADQDRSVNKTDSDRAWERSGDGRCRGCGSATISPRQRAQMHRAIESTGDLFDVGGVHEQCNGIGVLLWPTVTLVAKAVAEHVVPRSHGGRTNPGNLTNACTGCNNPRGNTSLDALGVVAYDRPSSELEWAD